MDQTELKSQIKRALLEELDLRGRTEADITDADAVLTQRQAELDDLKSSIEGEVRNAYLDLQTALLSVRQAENNKLPQLNLGLNGALYGLDQTYHGALDGIGQRNATGYGIMLNFSWTPIQITNNANAEISRANGTTASATAGAPRSLPCSAAASAPGSMRTWPLPS